MALVSLHYVGFLANVDESILGLGELGGCRIEEISVAEATRLVSRHFLRDEHHARLALFQDFSCVQYGSDSVFVARIEVKSGPAVDSYLTERAQGKPRMWYAEYHNALIQATDRLRLYRNGNIRAPLDIAYGKVGPRALTDSSGWTSRYVARVPFSLRSDEITQVKTFLDEPLTLELDYLNLALRFFDDGYHLDQVAPTFIVLMIGLEVLFSNSRYGVSQRLSRRVGSLFADNPDWARLARRRIRSLYEKRSLVVHEGNAKTVTTGEVDELRNYLRESIVRLARKGLPKETVLTSLDKQRGGPPSKTGKELESREPAPEFSSWIFEN